MGPESGDCPDCKSSASAGIHLKDNVRLRETSRHSGQHLERSQWHPGLSFWELCWGVETEGLCQNRAAWGSGNREKPDAGWRRNENKSPGPGSSCCPGAQGDLQCSPICFWWLVSGPSSQPHSYSGILKTRCLRDSVVIATWVQQWGVGCPVLAYESGVARVSRSNKLTSPSQGCSTTEA